MKVMVVDDEQSMLIIMKRMLNDIPEIDGVWCFQSTGEAYGFIAKNNVDIIYIDINMPEENGIVFARKIAQEFQEISIAFLTAYKEFALEAFDVYAFDYILKPISQERLEDSIQRIKRRFGKTINVFPPKLSVYCLGGVEIMDAKDTIIRFGSSKSMELLVYLIMKKGRLVSKWSIIEDVFRGMPSSNAETYLNSSVYKIRRALEQYYVKSPVLFANEGYKVDPNLFYVDFIDFEDRIKKCSEINDLNLDNALAVEKLYTGELFLGKDYYWSFAQKERFFELYIMFAKKLVKFLLKKKQNISALEILKKMLSMNEIDEEVNCLIMKVYACERNKALLLKHFKTYEKTIRKQLGISPSGEVINLYKELKKLVN